MTTSVYVWVCVKKHIEQSVWWLWVRHPDTDTREREIHFKDPALRWPFTLNTAHTLSPVAYVWKFFPLTPWPLHRGGNINMSIWIKQVCCKTPALSTDQRIFKNVHRLFFLEPMYWTKYSMYNLGQWYYWAPAQLLFE